MFNLGLSGDMDPILIFERDAGAAIRVAKSLAPLGIRLHSISNAGDIARVVNQENVLAVVLGPNETCTKISKLVRSFPGAGVPVFTYGPLPTLRRKIGAARLKSACNKIFGRSPISLPILARGTLDLSSRTLSFSEDVSISLARAECAILLLLAMNEGEIVYKNDILYELWGRRDRSAVRSLDVQMCMLRQKLTSWSIPAEILSVPRIGFILRPSAMKDISYLPLTSSASAERAMLPRLPAAAC